MNKTGIEYLDYTWNPIVMRCSPVSEGCANCWHLAMADRLSENPKLSDEVRACYAGGHGTLLLTDELAAPLKLKKPSIIGVQFMGDLFHENVTFLWIAAVFGIMAFCQRHTFIVLTKRDRNMETFFKMFHDGDYKSNLNWWYNEACSHLPPKYTKGIRLREQPMYYPLPNVIGMVTAENQRRADERISALMASPFALRGVSIEPMLGQVDISHYIMLDDTNGGFNHFEKHGWGYDEWSGGFIGQGVEDSCYDPKSGIDLVICGGESGPGARPMHPDWPRSLRDKCGYTKIPFDFKQWGEWAEYNTLPGSDGPRWTPEAKKLDSLKRLYVTPDGIVDGVARFGSAKMVRVGKKVAGRLLDGREWNQFPEVSDDV